LLVYWSLLFTYFTSFHFISTSQTAKVSDTRLTSLSLILGENIKTGIEKACAWCCYQRETNQYYQNGQFLQVYKKHIYETPEHLLCCSKELSNPKLIWKRKNTQYFWTESHV